MLKLQLLNTHATLYIQRSSASNALIHGMRRRCLSVRVHLWDLSGHDEYIDVRNELYGNTDAAFLVYDITQTSSFDNLETWLKELKKYGSQSPVVCLIGNKVYFSVRSGIATVLYLYSM